MASLLSFATSTKKILIWTYEGSPLDLNWLASNDNVFPMSIVLNEDNMHIC